MIEKKKPLLHIIFPLSLPCYALRFNIRLFIYFSAQGSSDLHLAKQLSIRFKHIHSIRQVVLPVFKNPHFCSKKKFGADVPLVCQRETSETTGKPKTGQSRQKFMTIKNLLL